MKVRVLFGPVNAAFVEQNLHEECDARACVPFGPFASDGAGVPLGPADNWETVCARLPAGWRPIGYNADSRPVVYTDVLGGKEVSRDDDGR